MDPYNNHLAFGAFANLRFNNGNIVSGFGNLDVPRGMKPVSDFRRTSRPLITMPFGPPGQWLVEGHEGGASSAAGFGRSSFPSSLAGRKVNQSGYLSLWDAQPRSLAPSWNPLLMQGGNMYVQSPNGPTLSDVVPSSFGRRRSVRKIGRVTKKTASKTRTSKARKTRKTRRT